MAKAVPISKGAELTPRQLRAIPCLVAAPTQEEGRRKAGISKRTLWRWMQERTFRVELSRQRNKVMEEAIATLRSNMTKAAQTLVDLLDEENPRLRRSVAIDIINLALKGKEMLELEERLQALEERVLKS